MAGEVTFKSQGEAWIHNKWRPAMAWLWLMVIVFDVIIFPIAFVAAQTLIGNASPTQWQPMTLSPSGIPLHVVLGSVVGITSWNRTREKLEGGLKEIVEET